MMGFGNNVDECVNNFNKNCKWPKVSFLGIPGNRFCPLATLFIQIFQCRCQLCKHIYNNAKLFITKAKRFIIPTFP